MADYLVTGANGFIGRALAKTLESQGHRVTGIDSKDGDIADPSLFSKLSLPKFDRVFHLAARTYVPDSWNQSQDFLKTNVVGTANVLELCKDQKTPITLVSGYLYGPPETLPIAETCPLLANNPYSLSKRLAETVGEFYHKVHGVPVTIIRPFNIYGPGQNIKFLIPTIVDQVLHSEKIEVQDLEPKRDYLYLDDVIEALIKTIVCKQGCNIYNIGSGHSLSVGEVIRLIQSAAGTNKQVVSLENRRPNEVLDVYADISKAQKELDWNPRFSFETGIKDMLKRTE